MAAAFLPNLHVTIEPIAIEGGQEVDLQGQEMKRMPYYPTHGIQSNCENFVSAILIRQKMMAIPIVDGSRPHPPTSPPK